MQSNKRTVLLLILIGVLVLALSGVFWLIETGRGARLANQAYRAAAQGDWERAYTLAGRAEAEGEADVRTELSYRKAEALLSGGDTDAAEQAFRALGAYRDAQTRVLDCRYQKADAQEQAGDLEAAKAAFSALGTHRDAQDRVKACGYAIAEQRLLNGDREGAYAAFAALIPYADSQSRAESLALALTGLTDPEQAMAELSGLTEADKAREAQRAGSREAIKNGRIATGQAHAVFLFDDGHVEAVGDNTFGQCDVSAFQSVTAVAAGYRHTLGLRSDGTVVSAGDGSFGQRDIGAWTEVKTIVCGPWDSYAIRTDGTLLHCGFNTFDLSGWTDLVSLAASETGVIGVKADGTVLCSNEAGRFMGGGFCDACVETGAAFALKTDGTVAGAAALSDWTDVLALKCSPTVLVGICADGTLNAHALLPCDEAFLNALLAETDVESVSVSGTFALVLHHDGKLSACGKVPEQIREFIDHMSGF